MEYKKLILRDELALDRTRLANQRTLLAYTRTGLYLIVTALAILKFSETGRYELSAWVLIGFGGLVAVVGIVNYLLTKRKINLAYRTD